jgi:hypothetical protein
MKLETTPSGKPITHGASAYNNHGCRCEVCTTAWAAYMRERVKAWRKKKKEAKSTDSKGVRINL